MNLLRYLLFISTIILTASWFSLSPLWKKSKTLQPPKKESKSTDSTNSKIKVKRKADEAKIFISKKGYNDQKCFLIDMSLPSSKNRFFLYDLKKDSIINKQLVAHGNCFEYWLEGRRYSNTVGSGCTSIGKYRIGNSYIGKFGFSYKLHGLDSTNSNAFERTIVLHSHSCIPDTEVADDICQSNGCPTVSLIFLQEIKKIVNASKKPVLLWIYE